MNVSSIGGAQFPQVARWIHAEMPQSEFATLLESTYPKILSDSETPRLEVSVDGERIAATYFTRLPGRVGVLGGVRAMNGRQNIAVKLVKQSIGELKKQAYSQIQAVVSPDDEPTQSILQASGFRKVATVLHLWLDVAHVRGIQARDASDKTPVRWISASCFSRSQLASFVAETIEDTLDCPAINGLRTDDEVLDGFLNGRPLHTATNWELMEMDGCNAGCLFMEQHSPTFLELTYMGVPPAFRGQGLGNLILQRAVEKTRAQGASLIVVAVDESNWPARRLYERMGFQKHRGLAVWLAS